MRIANRTIVAALALAAAACAAEDSPGDVSTEVNLAEDSAANDVLGADLAGNGAAAGPADAAGFANAVAAADLYEVESARIAADKSGNAEVKAFAGHLRSDHEQSTADLKSAAGASIAVTPRLDSGQQAMLDRLKAASGAEFDRLFVEQQKAAHRKALALLQGYAGNGGNPALKAFAGKAASAVQGHLDHAESIKL